LPQPDDFESHDGMTEENLYQKIFAALRPHCNHFPCGLPALYSTSLGKVTSSSGSKSPLNIRPIAHAIWDPQFGKGAVDAFTQAGASNPVNIAYSGVYHWFYTIGMTSNQDLYQGAVFLLILSAIFLFAGWLHLQPKFRPKPRLVQKR
jgi:photosystem I P700 chlorophyll a apoprotein A2